MNRLNVYPTADPWAYAENRRRAEAERRVAIDDILKAIGQMLSPAPRQVSMSPSDSPSSRAT